MSTVCDPVRLPISTRATGKKSEPLICDIYPCPSFSSSLPPLLCPRRQRAAQNRCGVDILSGGSPGAQIQRAQTIDVYTVTAVRVRHCSGPDLCEDRGDMYVTAIPSNCPSTRAAPSARSNETDPTSAVPSACPSPWAVPSARTRRKMQPLLLQSRHPDHPLGQRRQPGATKQIQLLQPRQAAHRLRQRRQAVAPRQIQPNSCSPVSLPIDSSD